MKLPIRILSTFFLLARASENSDVPDDFKLCPAVEINFTKIIDASDKGCSNISDDNTLESIFDAFPVADIFDLKHLKLVLILANDSLDAVTLAQFLTHDNKLLPQKKRDDFNQDKKPIYDYIVENFEAYEDLNTSTTFLVYPRHTKDEKQAEKLVIETVRFAKTIKIILTSSNSSDPKIRERELHRLFENAGNMIKNLKKYEDSCIFVITNGTVSGQRVLDPEMKTEKVYRDLIGRYANKSDASINGKLLAKMINDEDVIFAGDNKMVMDHLQRTNHVSANIYDYDSQLHQFLDCSFTAANRKLTSIINSIISKVSLKLHSAEIESGMTTLTGVLSLAEDLDTTYKSLSGFLDCVLGSEKSFLKICTDNLRKDLEPLGLDTQEDISSSNKCFSVLCWMERFSFITEIEYDSQLEDWVLVVRNYLKDLKNRRNWYWNLRRIFNDGNSLPEDVISGLFQNLLRELTVHGNYNVAAMKRASETVKENTKKTPVKITCLRESVVKLQVTGTFLKLSQILNGTLCRGYKILELFALEKITIDRDLVAVGQEMIVSIFAPVWEIVMDRRIILDGISRNLTSDDYLEPKARDGNRLTNRNGVDGLAGLPGGPAGAFYGLSQTIIRADKLRISLSGGNGSNGQDGGDGANGDDGETPSVNYIHSMFNRFNCRWLKSYEVDYRVKQSEIDQFYVSLFGPRVRLRYKDECYIFGQDGFPGGNGGNGGTSGKGGSAGDIYLYQLEDSAAIPLVLMASNGTAGRFGIGGKKGTGGFTRKVTIHNKDYFNYHITDNTTDVQADDGKDGKDNSSLLGSKIQKVGKVRQTFAQTVNLYKRYILSNIVKHDSKYIDLYRQVISNGQILKTYDTLALVNELIDLEKYYFKRNKKSDTLFMYESWKERLIYYSSNRKVRENTEEYSALHRSLDDMVSEKIRRLERNSNKSLIFMISDYLLQCLEQVKHLQNARTVVRIKKTNSKFNNEYNDKIEEAQRIIQEKLQKDIEEKNLNLEGELEMLLREISSLIERERRNGEALSLKSKAMEGRLAAKTLNEILELINSGLGFINPALATIGTKFGAAGSIVQNFIDDTADTNIEVVIPNMVDRSRDFFDNWVDLKCEVDKLAVERSLKEIGERKEELRQKGEDVKPLESIEYSIAELKNQSEPKRFTGNVMEVLDNKMTKEKSIWEKLNEGKKHIYTGALQAIEQIRTYTRIKGMIGDLSEKFEDIRSKPHVTEFNEEIHKAFERTVSLRKFKEQVSTKMIPLIEKIREETDLNGKVSASSIAYLDFKKFQMKKYFQQVLERLELFVKQFKFESLFESTLADMKEVIDMVLSTYERIEEYVETMQKADYEKDLYLAPFDVTYVKDPELSMSLAKMVQAYSANMVLDDSSKWMTSFKQYIFPFAHEFISVHDSPMPELAGLLARAEEAGKHLEFYWNKLSKKRAELREFVKTVPAKFGYSLPPFHVWNNSNYRTEIDRFLAGGKITVFASVFEHKFLNAVKFSDIWLRLRSTDPGIEEQNLWNDMRGFAVKLLHEGDSYYRCDDGVYLIYSNKHLFESVYNDREEEQFGENGGNVVTSGKGKGDYLLSPYATWTIELISRDVDKTFEVLKKYQSRVNIELVGLGHYTDRHLEVCETNLTKYYNKI